MIVNMKNAVLISCFNWYERLEAVAETIKGEYEIKILLSDFEHIKKTYIVDSRKKDYVYLHVPSYKSNTSFRRIVSHIVFAKLVENYIYFYQPDFIYLMLPPNSVANVCLQYKKRNKNCKYVIDVIDLWPESMPIGEVKKTPLASIWAKLRDDSIKKADYVFFECALYRKKLKNYVDLESSSVLYLFKEHTVKNQELIKKLIVDRPIYDGTIKIAYLGSINNIIDINGICNVIKILMISNNVEIHIIGDGERREEFISTIKNIGCKVFYYGSIYEEDKKAKILVPCDFGLNMMKSQISVGLTIKSIDYFSFGLPIINNIKGDTWWLVKKYDCGINIDDLSLESSDKIIEFIKRNSREEILQIFENKFSKNAFLKEIRSKMQILLEGDI